jgi:hypothetical protein
MFFIGKERKKELMYHIELLPYCRETQFLFPPRKSLVRTKKKVCIIIISSFCVCKGRLKMFRLLCMQTLRILKKNLVSLFCGFGTSLLFNFQHIYYHKIFILPIRYINLDGVCQINLYFQFILSISLNHLFLLHLSQFLFNFV